MRSLSCRPKFLGEFMLISFFKKIFVCDKCASRNRLMEKIKKTPSCYACEMQECLCAKYGFYKTLEEAVNAQIGKIGIIKEQGGGFTVSPISWERREERLNELRGRI